MPCTAVLRWDADIVARDVVLAFFLVAPSTFPGVCVCVWEGGGGVFLG